MSLCMVSIQEWFVIKADYNGAQQSGSRQIVFLPFIALIFFAPDKLKYWRNHTMEISTN